MQQALRRREFTPENLYRYYDYRSPLRWIMSHVMRYDWLPWVAILCSIISTLGPNQTYMLIGQGFDMMTGPDASLDQLIVLMATVLGLYVGAGLFGLVSAYSFEILAQRLERDAREELYHSLLGKSQTFHNRQRIGDIMARATNDVGQLNMLISPGLLLITGSVLSAVVPISFIALLRFELLLVPVLFLGAVAVALVAYMAELAPVVGNLRAQFGTLNAGLAEAISGIEVVKAYAQERREQTNLLANARRYRDLFVQEGQIRGRYLPLLLFGLAYGLAFAHALLLFQGGSLSLGEVVAFMGLFGALRFPTLISIFSFALVQMGIASAKRIMALILTETELDENAGGVAQPMAGALAFEHVAFGYNAGEPILKDITFHAQPGQTIAIVGQTGSGKSTLTRLVNRTYDVSGGHVRIDGVDVRDWSMQGLRSQISTIEQDIFLFSRSIHDNIAFGAAGQATRAQVEEAARQAQAHEFIEQFPDGYETIIGERGVTLSGGQRQRLAIARAFLTNPRILILDDSTSAIDSATEDRIQRAMRGILQGRTTLLITHRLSQIRWADHILVLQRGELVAQGTHEELMEQSDAYRRIFARYD